MRSLSFIRTLPIALVAAALVVACGGSDEPSAPDPTTATPQQETAAKPKTPAPPPVPDVPKKPKKKRLSLEEQLAVKVEIPDYYPSDAPVYPSGHAVDARVAKNGQANVSFTMDDDVNTVTDWVKSNLSSKGWNVVMEQELDHGFILMGTKDARKISVLTTAVERAGKSVMAVAVTPDA